MRRVPVVLGLLGASACGNGDGGEAGPAAADVGEITVFAAASLSLAIDDLAARHEAETGTRVRRSYAASSTLAKQIDAGAPADVYLSADPRWTEWLGERGRLAPPGARNLLASSLVVVAPIARPFTFDPEAGVALGAAFEGRLAMGDPDHVPAGVYARDALEHVGGWEAMKSRVVRAADARAVLAFVERGECAAGIVYAPDAASSSRVAIVAAIPPSWHAPIVYPVAGVAGRERPEVERFLRFLTAEEAAEIFRRHGFHVLADTGRAGPADAPSAAAP